MSVFGYESKEKHLIYVSKKYCEDKHVDSLLVGEDTTFLSKILIRSCIIILNGVEGNIFVVIVCKFSVHKMF